MSDLAAKIDRLVSEYGLTDILFREDRVGLRFYAEPLPSGAPLPHDWTRSCRLIYFEDLGEGASAELDRLDRLKTERAQRAPQKRNAA